ncbi:DUF4166 domain-containing protein [Paenibacillus aurantius]|uniref:DUF4166 domain-containing protein n=1 Tax=Paenibacillus aurantius TaxID=2918900 RepID=A0AA96LBU5_9BACL|nr:DUF4166 domain-containing protein [Paenibacillus aurantius]WNQ10746.1 DUF4166 domain-containing protein [Paenibacillus aurantius]
MPSIYEQALGSDFRRLHPQIQKRFGLHSGAHTASIGRGVMERIWYAKRFAFPFLYLGTTRHILFPEGGRNIPFTIQNYAYTDTFGRETVTWIRTYRFPGRVRRFDATMIYSRERGRIVDYLGTHQHLAVDIEMEATPEGGLRLRSGEQRFYERWLGFRFPDSLTGTADVCEWYDEREERFRIEVNVSNARFGKIFAYEGWFEAEFPEVKRERIPICCLPVREERRE